MAYFSTVDGCNLYYELIGQGPGKPLLTCINGTLQTTVNWAALAKRLSHLFSLLIYDCRGQGASDLGEQPLSLTLHRDDLLALLEELHVQETHLLGISHGARVALALVDIVPELVSHLVVCSISTRADFRARMIVQSWREILQRHSLDAMVWSALPHVFGRNYLKANEKMLERIANTIVRRNHTEALRAHLEAVTHYPPLFQSVKPLSQPLFLLNGEDDPLISEEGTIELADICGGRWKILPGIGHSITAEAPGRIADLVSDFFSGKNS